ncbi:MAG: WbuC family cupin fold metalloprotein [Muribaculum sp.]|nr:WbuC family cupin fold metalloprotein [Muribaculum sp.]
MKLDKALFDSVSAEAKQSSRLRMARDMRTSVNDQSQRMLNAIEPGTELPIHRHNNSTETCIILRGSAEEIFYDDNGNETERVLMKPDSECCGVNIEVGRWHKIISLEPGTVIFEAKDGAYEPLSQEDILNV